MAEAVLILGKSGTGKSYSIRNLNPEKTKIIQVESKLLPFIFQEEYKGKWKYYNKDTKQGNVFKLSGKSAADLYRTIQLIMKTFANTTEIFIIDDSQYLLSKEFMARALEKNYDKFTELAKHFYDLIQFIKYDLPQNVRVYFLHHSETNDWGEVKAKTVGKLLDNQITLEGLFSFVIGSKKEDGQYKFILKGEDNEPYKVPAGMFQETEIPNDIKILDDKIKEAIEAML